MEINAILAKKKAKNHKAPQRAPSLRELSSKARLKEYPARSENKGANPYETRLKEDIP